MAKPIKKAKAKPAAKAKKPVKKVELKKAAPKKIAKPVKKVVTKKVIAKKQVKAAKPSFLKKVVAKVTKTLTKAEIAKKNKEALKLKMAEKKAKEAEKLAAKKAKEALQKAKEAEKLAAKKAKETEKLAAKKAKEDEKQAKKLEKLKAKEGPTSKANLNADEDEEGKGRGRNGGDIEEWDDDFAGEDDIEEFDFDEFEDKPKKGMELESLEGRISDVIGNLSEHFNWKEIQDAICSLDFFVDGKSDECMEKACDNLRTTQGYCRLHYIKNYKNIKRKKEILMEGKLQDYITELISKHPPKVIEQMFADLSDDREFYKVLNDLGITTNYSFEEFEAGDSEAEEEEDVMTETRTMIGARISFDDEEM